MLSLLRRYWPVMLILAGLAGFFASGLGRELSLAGFAAHRAALAAFVTGHFALALLAYGAIYALAVALSVPGGAILTLAGGALFGAVAGTAATVLGASLGAVALFLAARYAFADLLRARAGDLLARIGPGLERDGFRYLLALRLIPAFPFWLVNLAPALVGMRLAPYVIATVVGIIPGTAVYASLGAGLDRVLAAGGTPDLGLIFRPTVLLPLLALALLSLLPILLRRRRRGDGRRGQA